MTKKKERQQKKNTANGLAGLKVEHSGEWRPNLYKHETQGKPYTNPARGLSSIKPQPIKKIKAPTPQRKPFTIHDALAEAHEKDLQQRNIRNPKTNEHTTD